MRVGVTMRRACEIVGVGTTHEGKYPALGDGDAVKRMGKKSRVPVRTVGASLVSAPSVNITLCGLQCVGPQL